MGTKILAAAFLTFTGLSAPFGMGIPAAVAGWEFVLEFGEFNGPDGIAVDSQGAVYVLDRGNDRLQVFNADGQFLREQTGFNDPRSVAIDENDVVYVLEACRVHRYTTLFQPLGSWDSCIGQGDLQHGRGLDVRDGLVCVATINDVLKFTVAGVFLGRFMDNIGWSDIHWDSDGSIWVVTSTGNLGLVRHYSADGKVLDEWNTILPGEQSSSPFSITIDTRERLFVADGRVKIFTSDGMLDDLIEVALRLLVEVELDGDNVLYVGTEFPDRVMKFQHVPVTVEPETWGAIKAQYR